MNKTCTNRSAWLHFFFSRIIVLVSAKLLLASAIAFAAPPPDVGVSHARIRLLPGELPLAGYFDISNGGKQSVVLIGASSPAFREIGLHHSSEKNGMSSMVPVHRIEVRAGETFHFLPDGYHLMLMGRKRPLRVGEKVPVTLRFAGKKTLGVTFEIEGADSQ